MTTIGVGVTLPDHVRPLVRGWLHGNVVALPGPVPTLVDSGYHTGSDEVWSFANEALGGRPAQLLLTHVHSDHAGGVAALRERGVDRVLAHPDAQRIVAAWDEPALWLGATQQHLPRFRIDGPLPEEVMAGDRPWRVLEAPGHATGGVMFLDERSGVLISGDALWEDGLGAVNPWIDGEERFTLARTTLDRIASLDVRWVVPGHGEPFTDVRGALARARSRLAYVDARRDRLQELMVAGLVHFRAMAAAEEGRPPAPADLARWAGELAEAFPVDGQDPASVARAALARLG